MKICKIINDTLSDDSSKTYSVILLCEYCYQADGKRGEGAEVISSEEYNSDYGISCEVCYKSADEEREEIR